jgi:hypothetical protein
VDSKAHLDLKVLALAEEVASKNYHDKRNELRDGSFGTGIMSKIAEIRASSRHAVDRCHSVSLAFKCAYSTILYPKFAVDQGMVSKSRSSALAKDWKGAGAELRHGEHRRKAVRKFGLMGKVVVNASEACSTMMCPWCMNVSSPGECILYSYCLC